MKAVASCFSAYSQKCLHLKIHHYPTSAFHRTVNSRLGAEVGPTAGVGELVGNGVGEMVGDGVGFLVDFAFIIIIICVDI